MRFLQVDFEQTKKYFNALKGTKSQVITELIDNTIRLSTETVKVSLKTSDLQERRIELSHEEMKTLCSMKTKGDLTFKEGFVYLNDRNTNIEYSVSAQGSQNISISDGRFIECECKELKETLKGVLFGKAKNESRPILTGVCFDSNKFVTVDGYRITMKYINTSQNTKLIPKIVIPGPTAELLTKVLPNKGQCRIETDGELVTISYENVSITSTLLQGEYLNYNQALTYDSEWELKTNRLKVLECVQFFLDKVTDKTKMEPIKLNLNIDSILTVDGNEIQAEYLKTGYKDTAIYTNGIFFNPKYLKEALEHINDDEIEIHLISALTPMIIYHSQGKDLILPIRKNA
nr:hypothetical protein [uncultured Cellulosilyticum sp.]